MKILHLPPRPCFVLFCSFLFFCILNFDSLYGQPTAVFRVHFEKDQNTIPATAHRHIVAQTNHIGAPEKYRVQLIGHADQTGSMSYNQKLSEQRAESVAEVLIDLGFQAAQMNREGLSFLKPLERAVTEDALARNRRVDVIIELAEGNVSSDYFIIPSQEATELTYERSGTKLHIPAHAFVNADGEAVNGAVILQYREFRDAADFIVSKLPMQLDYQGKSGYFNSSGMLEVKAYDPNGQKLFLKTGKEVGMEFVQTEVQQRTQLWRFDEATGQWFNEDEQTNFANDSIASLPVDTTWRRLGSLALQWPETNRHWDYAPIDTFKQLQAAYDLLPEILNNLDTSKLQYIAQLDFQEFGKRYNNGFSGNNYAGPHYIGRIPFRKAYRDKKYYNIKLRSRWSKRGSAYYQIEDLSGENIELKAFEGLYWKVRPRHLRKFRQQVRASKFSDIRVHRKPNSQRYFVLELKYKSRLLEIPAQLYHKKEGLIDYSLAHKKFRQYQRALKKRRQAFNRTQKEKAKAAEFLWPAIQLLLPKNLEEVDLSKVKAISEAVLGQDSIHHNWPTETLQKWYWTYAPDLPGYNFICLHGHRFKEIFIGRDQPNWQALLKNYQPDFYGTQTHYEEFQKAFRRKVVKMSLKQLSVFNLDVLKRFEEKEKILASFQNEKGKNVNFNNIQVVNHDLNGLLNFNKKSIYLDRAARNTILVYDKDGNIYYLPANGIKDLPLRGKASYTFQMKLLDQKLKGPDDFRKFLKESASG